MINRGIKLLLTPMGMIALTLTRLLLINQWKMGEVIIKDMMDAIRLWEMEC